MYSPGLHGEHSTLYQEITPVLAQVPTANVVVLSALGAVLVVVKQKEVAIIAYVVGLNRTIRVWVEGAGAAAFKVDVPGSGGRGGECRGADIVCSCDAVDIEQRWRFVNELNLVSSSGG